MGEHALTHQAGKAAAEDAECDERSAAAATRRR
jgi:hypothetical protein